MTTIRVTQGAAAQGSIVVKKNQVATTLESIPNVSATGLTNGDTLIYNSITNKWEAKPLTVDLGAAIDGGTY